MRALRRLAIATTCLFIYACGSNSDPSNDVTDPAGLTPGIPQPQEDDAAVDSDGENSTDSDTDANSSEPAEQDTDSNSTNTGNTEDTYTSGTGVQFCQPVTASVVFEPYATPDQGTISYGRHVPNPPAGFGWADGTICDLAESYGVDEIEVLVPYVRKRPDTDGVTTTAEWSAGVAASQLNYVTSRNDIDNLLLSPVPDYLDGSGYSRWRAMHDGTNLYVDIFVSSDSRDSIYTDSEQPWHDDSVELFIDGDNSKSTEYDGINDFQVTLPAEPGNNTPVVSGSSASGLGIFYRSTAGLGTMKYEVSINLESAGITVGAPFGFDIHINEDDNGGDRDAKWGWFEKTGNDRSWYDPSVLGTLLLTDCADRTTCGSYQALSK